MSEKQTLRMCIACREMKDKNAMLKIVKNKNGTIEIDKRYDKEGRGAYLCKDINCYNICVKKKCLNRAFKSNVENEILEKIKGCIDDK